MTETTIPEGDTFHPLLLQMGICTWGWGPSGSCPVQLETRLNTGEHISFRARGKSISLEIRSEDFGPIVRNFRLPVEILDATAEVDQATLNTLPEAGQPYRTKFRYGVGYMNQDQAATLVRRWIEEYLKEKAAGQS